MTKAKVWIDGNLQSRPCKILEGKIDKKRDGLILFKISYHRNFTVTEQWIPADRLVKDEKI